ncbi:MAG: bifunctional pyr operon transcriptional regulator/uracil phosphoribosyltransferase PyrR [Gammaproteobacteria bacterium]|nr:bifunctional pyr operon transcriptional regulator/uracil phosphoribosyltransferase PyrR [Gammaproteobacteria bacterium]MDH5776673.1 bifunctional pyr operon transcriptional regulator/uracil phosphoribosyltransferase PyrR [Gammaproteobacteria bacterium]
MSENDVKKLLAKMAQDTQKRLQDNQISDPVMIGIQTGGVWVAEALHQQLKIKEDLGKLNISFYRDDFTRIGMHPTVQPSSLPFAVDDRHIILVDDVLHTGRTIRAALNEIFDYGRPASVILAALVERSGRELPICADIVGKRIDLSETQHIKLTGPEPLTLELQEGK